MNDSTVAPNTWRRLEIVVENGKELQDLHWTHDLKAYPVVFFGYKGGKEGYVSQKQKPVDLKGGSNPVWNAYNEFELNTDQARQKKLYLFVRVNSKRKFHSGSRFVGEVSFAIEELLTYFGDAVDWKSVTLSVKNREGEEHGTVTFKYKFGIPQDRQPAAFLPQPADRPLPQPANGNAVAVMYKIFRAGVFFAAVLDLVLDTL